MKFGVLFLYPKVALRSGLNYAVLVQKGALKAPCNWHAKTCKKDSFCQLLAHLPLTSGTLANFLQSRI